MKTTLRTVGLAAMAAAVALAAPIWSATRPDFCTRGCNRLAVQNNSTSLVLSVKIVQKKLVEEDGTVSCEKVERRRTKNMQGGVSEGGDYFYFKANKSCTYEVTFKTTNGCTGDKKATLTPEKIAKGRDIAELTGDCGSLVANTRTILLGP